MISNLKEMLSLINEKYSERTAFRGKKKSGEIFGNGIKTDKGEYWDISYSSFVSEIEAVGTSLVSMGLKGSHIAVLSENRYEWVASYLAVICGTGVVVPLDRELPAYSLRYLLEAGNISAVFCSKDYEDIINPDKLPFLKYAVYFDKDENLSEKVLSYSKLAENGHRLLKSGDSTFSAAEIEAESMSAILFTSGTTGFSKGVMLSHKNIVSNIWAATRFEEYREHEIMLSVLPYHHAFECTVGILASLHFGATVCINDSLKYFSKNLMLFKPTGMFLVPAIIYAMYRKIQQKEKELGRSLTTQEVQLGVFGGRLTRIFSGSAPLKPELIKVFKNYGVELCQGYGLTETSPVVSSAKYASLTEKNMSSVGQPVPGCEVKITDGEILVKGPNVMLGYYRNQAATDEVFDNGWFKTGDLGYLDEEGFLYINGRKKNVIISAGGENVYPEEIEQYLYGSPFFADSLVYGGENKDTVTAVVYPNYDTFEGKSAEEIKDAVETEIAALNEKLPLYKQITCVKIRKTPFEKTTSNKVKRNDENVKEI